MILAKEHQQNILPDIRGTIVEEIKEFRKMPYALKLLKLWNYKKALKCVSKLKKISVVSDTLKKYMVNKYNMNSDNIFITPCLASENFKYDSRLRDLIRSELNICQDDVLIVFSSGSSGLWQKNEVLKILADKEMIIINLSKDNIKHKNIINKYVDYCKVPLYLNAADIAVIWRDKSIVNQAASPVKFSEYICCGLPVIANESVDSITDYITSSLYGLLINNMEDINRANVNKLLSLNRQEIADNGIRRLGVENITNQYLKIYSSF
jgi:glycosyltransferase involved in cell wall biosynthesis